MPLTLTWVPSAIDDLTEIEAFIAHHSPANAADVVSRIIAAAEDLLLFPFMGPCVREWNDEKYRQRIVYSYRLIYRLIGDQIQILAVWHGARLLPDHVRRRN